jgi:tripartite ATP-independent transporter DctM subunit
MSFLPLILMVVLFFLNMPVALALCVATLVYFGFMNSEMPVNLIIQRLVASNESFVMMAIPYFVAAGAVMNYAGISSRLIIYAFIADVSVERMFLGAIVPGILMTIALMLAVGYLARKRNYAAYRETRASTKEVLLQLKESSWALFLPFGLILGLRLGMFTPTEAGAVTVAYAVVVGAFIYRELKVEHIPRIVLESVFGTAAIMLIIAAASAFGYYLSWERIPQQAMQFLGHVSASPWVMLLVINLFLLFVGMFFEGTAALIILTPLLLPVTKQLGIDPIHFGVVMVVNLVIGGVTPPFGTMMFLTCALLNVKIADFTREGILFILALVAVLFLITYVPDLVALVPNLLVGK